MKVCMMMHGHQNKVRMLLYNEGDAALLIISVFDDNYKSVTKKLNVSEPVNIKGLSVLIFFLLFVSK
jgi:hypothetical protein